MLEAYHLELQNVFDFASTTAARTTASSGDPSVPALPAANLSDPAVKVLHELAWQVWFADQSPTHLTTPTRIKKIGPTGDDDDRNLRVMARHALANGRAFRSWSKI